MPQFGAGLGSQISKDHDLRFTQALSVFMFDRHQSARRTTVHSCILGSVSLALWTFRNTRPCSWLRTPTYQLIPCELPEKHKKHLCRCCFCNTLPFLMSICLHKARIETSSGVTLTKVIVRFKNDHFLVPKDPDLLPYLLCHARY